MEHHEINQPDFGTGHKKLTIYIFGLLSCALLTLIAFWWKNLTIIYFAAIMQLLIQVICFLRLNTKTNQSRINVISILFCFVILIVVIFGSIWIMWSLNYYMMH